MKIASTAKLPNSALPFHWGDVLDHSKRVMGTPIASTVETELRRITKNTLRTLGRYGFAGRNGCVKRAAKLEYILTQSFGFRILEVLFSFPKKHGKISWETVKARAARVNPRKPSGEYVLVSPRQKSDGGFRPIVKFQTIARANQSMSKHLIHARVGHSQYEYARKGRGKEIHNSDINNANRNGGVRALGTLDLKDCFTNIRIEPVLDVIPLSKAIIRNTIFIPKDTSLIMKTSLISANAVRAGLSQGSLSSVIVAGLVIKPFLDGIETRFRASYLDNICVGESTQHEAQEKINTLTEAFEAKYPSSPLFVKCSEAVKIGARSDILGYWPRPNAPAFGGGLRWSPSHKALRRFYVKAVAELLLLPYVQWSDALEKRAYKWANSFKLWGGSLGGREFLQTCFMLNIEPLYNSAHKHVQAEVENGKPLSSNKKLALDYAVKLMPECVLANQHGLCEQGA